MKHNIDDLVLLNMAGVGYIRLKALIDHFGSARDIMEASPAQLHKVKDIGPATSQKIARFRGGDALKKERALIERHGASVISVFDDDYPDNLKAIYDPPVVLYIKGRILEEDKTSVALVGSRKASHYGLNICRSLAGQLAGLGVTVVSGLARGVDSAAHRGALGSGGRTLAILGSGINDIYPPENKKLSDEIAASGALISEFPMNRPPVAKNFPIRNRVISGLSLGVIVVEAAHRSGALITADCALQQGRDVFAIPGKAGAATSAGTHRLIKDGAKLVDQAADIVEELNLAPLGPSLGPGGAKDEIYSGLNKAEKRICDILSDEPRHIDRILEECDLRVDEVMKLLLKLEIKKIIRQLPGKNFVMVN